MDAHHNSATQKKHVVVLPLPHQGHMNPLFHFALKIASMDVVVTFVTTEACHMQLLEANAGKDPIILSRNSLGLNLRSLHISDGLPLDFDRSLHRDRFLRSTRTAMRFHFEQLISKLSDQRSPPVSCIVADTFCEWPCFVAQKFGIPFASFFTQSAAVYSIYSSWDLLLRHGHLPFPPTVNETQKVVDYIPGLPPLKITDLPSFLQESDITTVFHELIPKSFESARKANWVLSNTVDDLETDTVAAIKECGSSFMSIGPLLAADVLNGDSAESLPHRASMLPERDCAAWLDSKPNESVIYVSFGSFSHCSAHLLQEFAMGLMQSKLPFLWVLRPDVVAGGSPVECVLPKEFVEGTRDQGMVVKWCSQLEVLRHPSVGGFVTHCGWNSVLEGLWVGVPTMGFPLVADQYTNCWILTEGLGVAKSVAEVRCRSRGHLRAAVPREDVSRSLLQFKESGEERRRIREKVKWAKERIRKTIVDENGSSSKNLRRFLNEIK